MAAAGLALLAGNGGFSLATPWLAGVCIAAWLTVLVVLWWQLPLILCGSDGKIAR
jgi:hypothetical protein